MTTLDAIILLLVIEALLAVAWRQMLKARQYGPRGTKPPAPPAEPLDDPSGAKGPLLCDRRATENRRRPLISE